MAPGIVVMAALGAQIADFAKNASWSNALPLGLTILLWIAVCLGGAVRGDVVERTTHVTQTIRIMTWNVHGTFKLNPDFDLEGVCSIIRKWSPDVVALQEVDSRGRTDDRVRTAGGKRSATTASMRARSSPRTATMARC